MKTTLFLVIFIIFSAPASLFSDVTNTAERASRIVDGTIMEKRQITKETLELTEAEGKQFWPIYKAFEDEMRVLMLKVIKVMDTFSRGYKNLSDDEANSLIDEILAMQTL